MFANKEIVQKIINYTFLKRNRVKTKLFAENLKEIVRLLEFYP